MYNKSNVKFLQNLNFLQKTKDLTKINHPVKHGIFILYIIISEVSGIYLYIIFSYLYILKHNIMLLTFRIATMIENTLLLIYSLLLAINT